MQDDRFECLIAFTRGKIVRVAGIEFRPQRSNFIVHVSAPHVGQVDRMDLLDAAIRAGNLIRQDKVWRMRHAPTEPYDVPIRLQRRP